MRVNTRWTEDEDETLVRMVQELGPKQWTEISAALPGRKGKQCRERWRNHLDPSIIHTPFTPEEDVRILELVEDMGTTWARICEKLPGRTENSIKNRFYSNLCKRVDTTIKKAKKGPAPKAKKTTAANKKTTTAAATASNKPTRRTPRAPKPRVVTDSVLDFEDPSDDDVWESPNLLNSPITDAADSEHSSDNDNDDTMLDDTPAPKKQLQPAVAVHRDSIPHMYDEGDDEAYVLPLSPSHAGKGVYEWADSAGSPRKRLAFDGSEGKMTLLADVADLVLADANAEHSVVASSPTLGSQHKSPVLTRFLPSCTWEDDVSAAKDAGWRAHLQANPQAALHALDQQWQAELAECGDLPPPMVDGNMAGHNKARGPKGDLTMLEREAAAGLMQSLNAKACGLMLDGDDHRRQQPEWSRFVNHQHIE